MDNNSPKDWRNLLVFGYASKIYRDDEKAQWIEDGRHLITLPGDSSLFLDRYDGRGALPEPVKNYEPLLNYPCLTPEELDFERKCDAERYRDCNDVETEEGGVNGIEPISNTDRSPGYSTFNYSYDSTTENEKVQTGNKYKSPHNDKKYTPPPGLYVPSDLLLPTTMKSHAIIEKTALFVSSHGTQMEIILKTKQGSNPMFNFLTFNSELNPYYRYLVNALKTRSYIPEESADTQDDMSPHSSTENSDDEDTNHYLHPSLISIDTNSNDSPTKCLPEYKSSGPGAYSLLVSRLQQVAPQRFTSTPFEVISNPSEILPNTTQVDIIQSSLPVGDVALIIEKMAQYVVKNGPAFESLASTKGDPRFTFLEESHPYHKYYISCKQNCKELQDAVIASEGFVPYGKEGEQPSNATQLAKLALSPNPRPLQTQPEHNTATVLTQPDHANALHRMATLPPALIDKIEQLRRKTLENRSKCFGQTLRDEYVSSGIIIASSPLESIVLSTLSPQPDIEVATLPSTSITDKEEEHKHLVDQEIRLKAERRKKAAMLIAKLRLQEHYVEELDEIPLPPTIDVATTTTTQMNEMVKIPRTDTSVFRNFSFNDGCVELNQPQTPELELDVTQRGSRNKRRKRQNSQPRGSKRSSKRKRAKYRSHSAESESDSKNRAKKKKSKKKKRKKEHSTKSRSKKR